MKLSEFLNALTTIDAFRFQEPNGRFVPPHFHITEVGVVNKHFIDCGGTERRERVVNFQLWSSNDIYHRLQPKKVMDIIHLSQQRLGITDDEIEVEYQGDTIGKYGVTFDGTNFQLVVKHTDCLARETCETPSAKGENTSESSCCSSAEGCC